MQRHQRPGSRPVAFVFKSTIAIPLAVAVLFLAPAAGTEDSHGPNPDNVLVIPKSSGGWLGPWIGSRAAAAPRSSQRVQRVRPRAKTRAAPAAEAATSGPQTAEPSWPNAAATVGTAALIPITVKTVREMVEPAPDGAALVFENELSDIDLAARPVLTPTPAPLAVASTDGRATSESVGTEQSHVFAMAETMKTLTQSAWLEPVLLVLAGALAAFSAMRLFA